VTAVATIPQTTGMASARVIDADNNNAAADVTVGPLSGVPFPDCDVLATSDLSGGETVSAAAALHGFAACLSVVVRRPVAVRIEGPGPMLSSGRGFCFFERMVCSIPARAEVLLSRKLVPFALSVLVVALSEAASAFPNEPDGFDRAEFGMSVKSVREIFPGLQELAVEPGSPWAMYQLAGQSYGDLKPCAVVFGFFDDKLYEAKLDCGRDEKVKSVLYERFGPPSVEEPNMAIWRGEKVIVSMNRQAMTFAIADPARSRMLHQFLLQRAMQREFDAREKAAEPAPAAP
jgi:hypothetical protein